MTDTTTATAGDAGRRFNLPRRHHIDSYEAPGEVSTPWAYAKSIAYIGNASTIRARVCDMYGRAPSVEEIEQLIAKRRGERRAYADAVAGVPCQEEDEPDFRVAQIAPWPFHGPKQVKRGPAIAITDLSEPIPDAPKPLPTYTLFSERLFELIEQHTKVSREQFLSPSRSRAIVRARWIAMSGLREYGLSMPNIARRLGLKDHTTVMHGLRQADRVFLIEPRFAQAHDRVLTMARKFIPAKDQTSC